MIRQTQTRNIIHFLIVSVMLLAIAAAGCTDPNDKGTLKANRSPETRLSNVPPPGTISTSPLVSLSWLGDDADGFVVAYRYRWSFQLNQTSPVEYKPYTYLLNIMVGGMALIMEGNETQAPEVYKFFSTLPPEGLDTTRVNQLARGDTLEFVGVPVYASNPDDERYPTHESPSAGTFIFDSQDSLNPHTFEVSAIDNNGFIDPTPALLDFFTPIVPPPDVVVQSGPTDTVLVMNELTDTYRGTTFTFQGFDPNSRTIEYSWIIDRDEWPENIRDSMWSPFSLDPTARVDGSHLPDPYKVHHRIFVRARNEFGSISTRGFFTRPVNVATDSARLDTFWAHRDFNTVYPEFAKPGAVQRILLINNTFNWDTQEVLPGRPSRATLLQYYKDMYDAIGLTGKYDVYNVEYTGSAATALSVKAWPGLGLLGKYTLIHIVGDVTNGFTKVPQISGSIENKITSYCNAGGKVLINGWNLARADNMTPAGDFHNNILHILSPEPQDQVGDPEYVGSIHQPIPDDTQYPDAPLDQSKLYDTAWHGGMPDFYIHRAYGFGEIIYRFDSKSNYFFIENAVIGVRYIGLTYDVIYLGFPLYYTEKPAAIELLRKAFRDLKHL